MGPTMDVDINQIFEEVSESVCAGHAFRETHAGPGAGTAKATHCVQPRPSLNLHRDQSAGEQPGENAAGPSSSGLS